MHGSSLRLMSLVTSMVMLLAGCEQKAANPATAARPPVSVKVITTEVTPLSSTINALGTLSARKSIIVTTTVSEKLTGLYFEDGQYVKKGTLLATLAQAEERALLAAAKADLAEQEREISRLKPLLEKQVAARNEYDQRVSARDRVLAQIAEAEAKIDERTLHAPFAGYVGLRAVSTGALLSPGDPITTLDDLNTLQLDFQLPSLALPSLHIGQQVEAISDALNETFTGKISAVDQRIDPVSRSITARALLDNPEGKLKPGMLMRVSLQTQPREGIEVPEEALLSSQDEHFLWLIDPQQQARKIEVKIGVRRPGKVEIRSGLKAGDRVIVEGFMSLRPGTDVVAKEA
jgi:membrane fusion protein, multidrug efflux system